MTALLLYAIPIVMTSMRDTEWHKNLLADAETLESGIWQVLSQVDDLKRECRALEERLREFLEEYYREIGEESTRLEALEEQLDAAAFRIQHLRRGKQPMDVSVLPRREIAVSENDGARPRSAPAFSFDLDQEMRRTYRRLAKHAHPDSSALMLDTSLFPDIADAYARRDLPALKKLERQLQMENTSSELKDSEESLTEIAVQLGRLHEMKTAYQRKKRMLECHPAVELRSRALAAKLDGEDFYARLRQWFSRRINEAEAELYAKKRELDVLNKKLESAY